MFCGTRGRVLKGASGPLICSAPTDLAREKYNGHFLGYMRTRSRTASLSRRPARRGILPVPVETARQGQRKDTTDSGTRCTAPSVPVVLRKQGRAASEGLP